jgi:predicted TIM-barrel fold metal-dependent hydrolase
MLGRTPVIDADAHKLENPVIFLDYLDGQYRDRVRIVSDARGQQRVAVADRHPTTGAVDLVRPYPHPDSLGTSAVTAWQPQRTVGALFNRVRLADMDREGIDVQIVYGSLALSFNSLIDRDLAIAFCHAYNDYIRDDCAAYGSRLFPVAVLPLQDVAEAIREMHRCVDDLGMVAVMISPSLPIPHPQAPDAFPQLRAPLHLSDQRFFPLYEAAEKLDVAIAIHGVPGPYLCSGSADQLDSSALGHLFAERSQQQMALAKLVIDGILERFPKLRFGFVGAGCGWLPDLIHALGGHWRRRVDDFDPSRTVPSARLAWESLRERPTAARGFVNRAKTLFTMLDSAAAIPRGNHGDGRREYRGSDRNPEEYFARGQVFTTVASDDPAPLYLKTALGPPGERLCCWSSDYGHGDAVVRGSVAGIAEHPEIGIDFAERLLARNALRFYGRRLEERLALRLGSKRKDGEATRKAASNRRFLA